MERYGWSYQELLDTPKIIFDWTIELMEADARKSKHDSEAASAK